MRRSFFLRLVFLAALSLAAPLTLENPRPISELDKNYRDYARRRTLVQVRGEITHQDKAANNWAFLEDSSGAVLLDFSSAPPDVRLPRQKIGSILIVEGRVSLDETVLNGYVLLPEAYKTMP
ncbi:MAG: OB-fold nucleic acid binding domain-containing protein [Candidatus Margulisbacteria bacterium]|jgi:hypothetical protein|nr:OB-fold nucleic acid binding domain-containing protein [Candidatus Margulisiibacteriota bacterium]